VTTPIDVPTTTARFRSYRWTTVVSKLALVLLGARFPYLSLAVFVAPELWLVYSVLIPNTSGLVPVKRAFAATGREVWLTIDDGPDPETTPALLDSLDSHGAKAVFFVIGEKVRRHPELARLIAQRGHELGNHTQSHPLAFFWCAGGARTAREIDGCCDAILEATQVRPRFFRSPAGIKNLFLCGVLARRGLAFLGWSSRARELGYSSPERPLRRLVRGVKPGAILLTHDSGPNAKVRAEVIRGLLAFLSAEGYRCVLPPAGDGGTRR
jgi:peptidoglycan/xylan/chitin deacetylase (PgdA/CDA1 family)